MIRLPSHYARFISARFVRSARGNASVELAFILPFLLLLATGSYDLGRAFIEKLRLNGAARAGTQYALQLGDTSQDASRSFDLIFDLPFTEDHFTILGHAEMRLR